MLTRRNLLTAAFATGALSLTGCASGRRVSRSTSTLSAGPVETAPTVMPAAYGPIPNERFPIPAVPEGVVPAKYWRRRVDNPFPELSPGTIVVNPNTFYLHLVEGGGTAMRYGIGVGRQGFEWSGDAVVRYKRKWPTWTPPAEMIERQPELARYSAENGGQAPGLNNPLGARALYLFQNGEDTLYRFHGTPEAYSIGKAVSSGCVRLLNHDVIDLYERVADGSRVIVRSAGMPSGLS